MKLFNILVDIFRHIRSFGKTHGLIIFYKIKTGKTESLNLRNIKYPISLRPGTSDIPTFYQIFYFVGYNFHLDFKPKTIIDAGANIGLAAIYFANKYPEAKIYSIEPELSNFDMLKKNTKDYDNVICLNNALSDVNGQELNIVDVGLRHWGFMTETVENSSDKKVTGSIKTISIPEIMERHKIDILDIVKIDIEGFEKELFETNTDWISKSRCIVVELHDRMKKGTSKSVFQEMSKHDFSFDMKSENLIFINNNPNL